eukprot:6049994-Lingulodinium_polyedra.AAC.1
MYNPGDEVQRAAECSRKSCERAASSGAERHSVMSCSRPQVQAGHQCASRSERASTVASGHCNM